MVKSRHFEIIEISGETEEEVLDLLVHYIDQGWIQGDEIDICDNLEDRLPVFTYVLKNQNIKN